MTTEMKTKFPYWTLGVFGTLLVLIVIGMILSAVFFWMMMIFFGTVLFMAFLGLLVYAGYEIFVWLDENI